jgi:alpha-tubulin suppressor-like RCC1 family protein
VTFGDAKSDVDALADVEEVAVGREHVCARIANGTVRCWGFNTHGELGSGKDDDAVAPVLVSTLENATQLSTSMFHTCARTRDGNVRCWGYNEHGQLGDGTRVYCGVPTMVAVFAATWECRMPVSPGRTRKRH